MKTRADDVADRRGSLDQHERERNVGGGRGIRSQLSRSHQQLQPVLNRPKHQKHSKPEYQVQIKYSAQNSSMDLEGARERVAGGEEIPERGGDPIAGSDNVPGQLSASACVAFPDARRPACAMEIGDLRVERECHCFDGLNERFGPIGADD